MTSMTPVTECNIIGNSNAIRQLREELEYAARSDAKVLVTGESGVGKEIVARIIHQRSVRAHAQLVSINCAGVPDSLLESELFGHVRGSFTGAYRDKRGWLETANGGTIFMDEVGEMSLRMQAMLLRFLETGEIQRVGSDSRMAPLNVRVITATHRRLLDAINSRDFREDLYYRLNVVHIEVPPLRERLEDVPLLVGHFLRVFSDSHRRPIVEVSPDAMAYLTEYTWPGNVRELKNITERLVLKCRTGVIGVDMLPLEVTREKDRAVAAVRSSAPAEQSIHEELFGRLLEGTETFWSGVYEPFMSRDLTRRTVRELIRLGLEHTRGNYKLLVTTFNMAPEDYKKFLNFLQKYQCHVPFQGYRMMRAPASTAVDSNAGSEAKTA
jgi:transcriptional regulator with PAS, ATPase and Fis domain